MSSELRFSPPPSNTVAIPVSLFFPEKMGLRLRNCTEV
jgi:hypothetical protein